MKRNKARIVYSWLLLLCFIAGQFAVYAHQHKIITGSSTTSYHHTANQSGIIIQEKCSLCDAMHFNTMMANEHPLVVHLFVASPFDYKAVTRTFISLSFILSPGRAPPVS